MARAWGWGLGLLHCPDRTTILTEHREEDFIIPHFTEPETAAEASELPPGTHRSARKWVVCPEDVMHWEAAHLQAHPLPKGSGMKSLRTSLLDGGLSAARAGKS